MSGPATYCMMLPLRPRGATPVSPPPQPVRDRLRTLGLWAPCRPVWSRDGDPGLRFVRRRGCRTGRRERKQTLSADRTCPQLSSPTPRDYVSSSAVLGCLNVRSLLRKYDDDVIELCRDRRIADCRYSTDHLRTRPCSSCTRSQFVRIA